MVQGEKLHSYQGPRLLPPHSTHGFQTPTPGLHSSQQPGEDGKAEGHSLLEGAPGPLALQLKAGHKARETEKRSLCLTKAMCPAKTSFLREDREIGCKRTNHLLHV